MFIAVDGVGVVVVPADGDSVAVLGVDIVVAALCYFRSFGFNRCCCRSC